MRWNVGDRVYAIAGKHGDVVRVFGPGTYAGLVEVPKGRGFMGIEIDGHENHCIDLDTGEQVFGHECWWGSPEKMDSMIGDATKETITIAEYYEPAKDDES